MSQDVLDLFHPALARWFRESFAAPTPAQVKGWPRIAAGEHTLILAPTGSGKTLAAFLYAIHELLSHPRGDAAGGVHTLYISPLKALANDIEKNLSAPLGGAAVCASRMGLVVPEIRVGLRTGDTPPSERQRMVRFPPDLLITTPESLHLILTSPKARDMLRTVQYVIVDEIHSLVPSKRGTFLALLLERLEELVATSPIRIGLSATQRPLELVAQFLGGCDADGVARPVAVVDAGMRKNLDIEVVLPVDDMTDLPRPDGVGPTIWSSIFRRLLDEIEQHESTLVFANNRRLVERVAAELNQLAGHDLVRAHHGSVSREHRLEIEKELKAGKLPALAATSSLELGIDVGAIDLVCQVEAPVSVASALQRVGRAGHLVRETSKGRLLPKTRDDLLRMAAIARGMIRGEISAAHVPRNPLDVLAQQIVAMVALDSWQTDALYRCVRRAYPYRDLPREAFTAVLELVSGRYRSPGVSALRPRIAWDRQRDVLDSLPGSRQAVVLNGGTIPDTGQYAMVLEDGKTKLGELDEEFVFERRLGQTILLGTTRWRIVEIGADRVLVSPSEETEAVMPFWKGEGLGHNAEHGRRLGAFIRECEMRLESPDVEAWLGSECALDASAAKNLVSYLSSQRARAGVIPNDQTILIDAFRNEVGDPRLVVLSPYGRAFHLALLLAIQGTLREEGCKAPQAVFSNVGILFRIGGVSMDELVGAVHSLSSHNVEQRITAELEHTPYFALRFRRNAARALLLPRARPGRRTPLWLQRLRAHDLLDYAKEHSEFPVILETYREILEDLLPLDALRGFLSDVHDGRARFVLRKDPVPSPFTASLTLDFVSEYLYGSDEPAPPQRSTRFDRQGMIDLLRDREGELELDPDALLTMDGRLQGIAAFDRARDGVELVDLLRRIGDVSSESIPARCESSASDALADLIEDGRIARVRISGVETPDRLVAAEDAERYERWSEDDRRWVVRRFVWAHAGVTQEEIEQRYSGATGIVKRLVDDQDIVRFVSADGRALFADPDVLAGVRRLTLAKRRRAQRVVTPEAFAAAVLRRQHVGVRVSGEDGLCSVVEQLAGCVLPIGVWLDVIAARVEGFRFDQLEALVREGRIAWRAVPGAGQAIALAPLDAPWAWPELEPTSRQPTEDLARRILERLDSRGAAFAQQIARDLDARPSDVATALWEMTWQGLVTNDSLSPILAGRPAPAQFERHRGTPWGGGRWSLVESETSARQPEYLSARLRLLFDRYGVLCRELVRRERVSVAWRDAYPALSRMEWRGEADRGLFVSGLSGLQFAGPGVAATLHAPVDEDTPIMIHANDPANVWGDPIPIELPDGSHYTLRRHPGNYLILIGGKPILVVENHGERLVPVRDIEAGTRREALGLLRRLVEGPLRRRSIRIRTWGGAPIIETPAAGDLEGLGFMREDESMILYRDFSSGAGPGAGGSA